MISLSASLDERIRLKTTTNTIGTHDSRRDKFNMIVLIFNARLALLIACLATDVFVLLRGMHIKSTRTAHFQRSFVHGWVSDNKTIILRWNNSDGFTSRHIHFADTKIYNYHRGAIYMSVTLIIIRWVWFSNTLSVSAGYFLTNFILF